MDNHLNQKMDGSEPQNLPFLLLSSKAIIKSDVYDSTLNGSRTSPGYGQTGRMAGMGRVAVSPFPGDILDPFRVYLKS